MNQKNAWEKQKRREIDSRMIKQRKSDKNKEFFLNIYFNRNVLTFKKREENFNLSYNFFYILTNSSQLNCCYKTMNSSYFAYTNQ
ncbi:hypothetical protein BpHYR1_022561 [Brachionus plicatilis]|uniref:Uncharacterized protein n=1 Tax=Brachionus plicatilis TaxID=10195 RepID=A0A3M7PYN1_BRAPC|nr:hypothetical protein BpHYR1_022561 [Brachionus plicatilis]